MAWVEDNGFESLRQPERVSGSQRQTVGICVSVYRPIFKGAELTTMVDTIHNSLEKGISLYYGSHASILIPSFPWIKLLRFQDAVDINLHTGLLLSPNEGFQLSRFCHIYTASLRWQLNHLHLLTFIRSHVSMLQFPFLCASLHPWRLLEADLHADHT